MNNIETKKPRVGVGVMLLKDNKVLLGKRHEDPKKADSELRGEGTWTMPGGKVDFQETVLDAACREAFEETSIKIDKKNLEILTVQDDIVPDSHFVTIGFLCKNFQGDAKVMEPDEITEWKWYNLDSLPEKIFPPSQKMLNKYLNK